MTAEYTFPEAQNIVVSGDIHGDFNTLVHKCCVRYGMTGTLIIVAGDCGFGFNRPDFYENVYTKNRERLAKSNNWIVMVRGNHDNPAYFVSGQITHNRFMTVPDYSIIRACGHTILCVGGAVSIDRSYRISNPNYHHITPNPFARNLYWADEKPVYDKTLLDEITKRYAVDSVVTHTSPTFCEPINKIGLEKWAENDETLFADIAEERATMDKLHAYLLVNGHDVTNWFYGHFHRSWHDIIGNCRFRMLDIMELTELKLVL